LPQLSLHTPIGALTFSEERGVIVALDWGWGRDQSETLLLRCAKNQMHEYLDGERQRFTLPIKPTGTLYQQRVWTALSCVPYGHTTTYSDIAQATGGRAQSIGRAIRSNPLPILIPGHRAVGKGDTDRNSDPEALAIKRYLLRLEERAG
jgi:methylated-DNA-[protein]-cysteine S-methyltransferase